MPIQCNWEIIAHVFSKKFWEFVSDNVEKKNQVHDFSVLEDLFTCVSCGHNDTCSKELK